MLSSWFRESDDNLDPAYGFYHVHQHPLTGRSRPIVQGHSRKVSHSDLSHASGSTDEAKRTTPLEAFIIYRGELYNGISASGQYVLANQLYSNKIISREALDSVMGSEFVPPAKRIISLIDAIEASIKQNPSAFYQFLAVLKEHAQLSIVADMLYTTAGEKQPPCTFCGSFDHWFPEVQKLSHLEAERALSYLKLLNDYTKSQEETPKDAVNERCKKPQPSYSFMQAGVNMKAEEEIKGTQYDLESQDSKSGSQGKKEGIPPSMSKEIRKLFQGRADDPLEAFMHDVEIYIEHKECFIMYTEQIRSKIGQCSVKRSFDSPMLSFSLQL